jgi:hypothetical protein
MHARVYNVHARALHAAGGGREAAGRATAAWVHAKRADRTMLTSTTAVAVGKSKRQRLRSGVRMSTWFYVLSQFYVITALMLMPCW